MPARLPTALITAAAALGVAGCAQSSSSPAEGFEGREKPVAEAVEELVAAARRGDARKICDSLVTPALRGRYEQAARAAKRGDCADGVEQSIRDADAFDLELVDVRVAGRRATVRARTKTNADEDPVATLDYVENRGWRLDAVQ